MIPKSFVTNIDPNEVDVDKYLRVAKQLDLPAWIGESIDGMPGTVGFYVFYKITNLTHFWEMVRA